MFPLFYMHVVDLNLQRHNSVLCYMSVKELKTYNLLYSSPELMFYWNTYTSSLYEIEVLSQIEINIS